MGATPVVVTLIVAVLVVLLLLRMVVMVVLIVVMVATPSASTSTPSASATPTACISSALLGLYKINCFQVYGEKSLQTSLEVHKQIQSIESQNIQMTTQRKTGNLAAMYC